MCSRRPYMTSPSRRYEHDSVAHRRLTMLTEDIPTPGAIYVRFDGNDYSTAVEALGRSYLVAVGASSDNLDMPPPCRICFPNSADSSGSRGIIYCAPAPINQISRAKWRIRRRRLFTRPHPSSSPRLSSSVACQSSALLRS